MSIYTGYGTQVAVTLTLASLASDSSLLAGRASTAVATGNVLDYLLSGKVKAGTSPTASKQVEVWVWGQENDTPTYPDGITGTDAAKTATSSDIKEGAMRRAATLGTDSTTGRTYYFGPVSVAQLFGGVVPKRWGVFVVHNTGVALDSTGGNHEIVYLPITGESA